MTTPTSLTDQAVTALQDAVAKVVAERRRQRRPLATWQGGKAVWLPTEAAEGAAHEAPAPYVAANPAPPGRR